MLIKIHKASRYVVAVCDSDLIGKKFQDSDGLREIDLTTTFFKGEEKEESEIIEILKDMKMEDASFNIVGKKAYAVAKKAGLIEKESFIEISGIPVILILA